jgi:hypothetical protein
MSAPKPNIVTAGFGAAINIYEPTRKIVCYPGSGNTHPSAFPQWIDRFGLGSRCRLALRAWYLRSRQTNARRPGAPLCLTDFRVGLQIGVRPHPVARAVRHAPGPVYHVSMHAPRSPLPQDDQHPVFRGFVSHSHPKDQSTKLLLIVDGPRMPPCNRMVEEAPSPAPTAPLTKVAPMATINAPPAAPAAQAAPKPAISIGTAIATPRASLCALWDTNAVVGVAGSSEIAQTERCVASVISLCGLVGPRTDSAARSMPALSSCSTVASRLAGLSNTPTTSQTIVWVTAASAGASSPEGSFILASSAYEKVRSIAGPC